MAEFIVRKGQQTEGETHAPALCRVQLLVQPAGQQLAAVRVILGREDVPDERVPGLDPAGEREGEEGGVAHKGRGRCADVVGEVLVFGVQHIVNG